MAWVTLCWPHEDARGQRSWGQVQFQVLVPIPWARGSPRPAEAALPQFTLRRQDLSVELEIPGAGSRKIREWRAGETQKSVPALRGWRRSRARFLCRTRPESIPVSSREQDAVISPKSLPEESPRSIYTLSFGQHRHTQRLPWTPHSWGF